MLRESQPPSSDFILGNSSQLPSNQEPDLTGPHGPEALQPCVKSTAMATSSEP